MLNLDPFGIEGPFMAAKWGDVDAHGYTWQLKRELSWQAIEQANSRFLPLQFEHGGTAIGFIDGIKILPDGRLWCKACVNPMASWEPLLLKKLPDIRAGRINKFSIGADLVGNHKTIYGIQRILEISIVSEPAVAGSSFNRSDVQANLDELFTLYASMKSEGLFR